MTKVVMKEKTNRVEFGDLYIGDCFLDADNAFCIKINSTTCLVANEDLKSWEEYPHCDCTEIVYPVDTEIHIID